MAYIKQLYCNAVKLLEIDLSTDGYIIQYSEFRNLMHSFSILYLSVYRTVHVFCLDIVAGCTVEGIYSICKGFSDG